jgi:GH24 family phage-related lysozyme (muramidase)
MGNSDRLLASSLSVSPQALALLKQVETLRLSPYDDQTGALTSAWVSGATIGYGHLIHVAEWDRCKNGISLAAADDLLGADLEVPVTAVRSAVTVALMQQQFDALVILAFNIGATGLAGSSVVKLVNDPAAHTPYASLEAAWMAWDISQGKLNQGLRNRRQCEWNIYSLGVYQRW